MSKSSLGQLQKVANEIASSHTAQEKMDGLTKAFELFCRETTRLETAYATLQERFEAVNKKLTEANIQLKQKVLELDVTADYLDNIVNNMSQGLLFISTDGIITTYNTAAENILGIDRMKVLSRRYSDLFPDNLFGFSMKESLLHVDVPKRIFVTLPEDTKNPEKREIEVETTFVLKDSSREGNLPPSELPNITMGLIIMIRDITELQKLQAIASRNDRMKELGEMAAMVAHEIRNPLGSIKGFASLLVRDLNDFPKLKEMASFIVRGTDELNHLVTNVLNYTRPLKLEWEQADLSRIIRDLIKQLPLDSSIPKSVSFEGQLPEQPVLFRIDLQLFKGALLNLLVNAVQSMPQGGSVKVSLCQNAEEICLTISDTGEGIPPQNIDKLFRPFFTTKIRGHGFGLAEVQRAIQAHNGIIEVQSTVGKGTTFMIKLKRV